MRWEDERYVRFYTRDTPEWLALSWRARGLFGLILRCVDRAGVLAVGKLGRKGLAVAIQAPWVEVDGPLAELIEDGCVVWDEPRTSFFLPNYLSAQECPQSDMARKRASREKARAQFGGGSEASEKARSVLASQSVTTHGHETGPEVTNGHTASQSVTLNLPIPSVTEPKKLIIAPPAENQPSPPVSPFVEYVSYEWPDLKNPPEFERRARAAFPAVDPLVEAKKARGWELSEPSHRKVKHGTFLWNWLGRAQQGASVNGPGIRPHEPPSRRPGAANLHVDNEAHQNAVPGRKFI